jgi:hypothetical protein
MTGRFTSPAPDEMTEEQQAFCKLLAGDNVYTYPGG